MFGILGPTAVWDETGAEVAVRPRHRAVLARLIVAEGRAVPLATLIDDLWSRPPRDPAGAVRTFVGDLRRAVEPGRAARGPAELLVTVGRGYALRADQDAVDARRYERAVERAGTAAPADALRVLDRASACWRGPALADVADEHWARGATTRLTELRLHAVELAAGAHLDLGRAADAVPDLDAHVTDHPWREEGWRLLALALYRSGRQTDALDVLRRARSRLVEQLGLEPGPALAQLEADVLRHAPHLGTGAGRTAAATPDAVWARTAAHYDRTVAVGARARLRSSVDLLRSLAVTGADGLVAAREQRLDTVLAAERLGDDRLTAHVIGAYDVPAVWSRSDDEAQAAHIVAAAERRLAALPDDVPEVVRARLLATVAIEGRGGSGDRARQAAAEAERLARRLRDPALLVFALNGVFLQSFHRAGLARQRDAVGRELVEVSARHGLSTSLLLGHLVRLQAAAGLGDVAAADRHAAAADDLAQYYESPLVEVFTSGYRALRTALTGADPAAAEAAYRTAAARMDTAGMPGLGRGHLALALIWLRLHHDLPVADTDLGDAGPNAPWTGPLLLLARGRRDAATAALRRLPDPPPDHLLEARWCLAARAAIDCRDHRLARRARTALAPAAGEIAGAGSGLLTVGPVTRYLDELAAVPEAG